MSIRGLGSHNQPFLYLDDFVPAVDMEKLHNEVCFGIAKAKWNKRYVSSGYHLDFKAIEVTPYIYYKDQFLTPAQVELMDQLEQTDEKIKFINAVLGIAHPFWAVFIRNNKRIERTGIENKSVGTDSFWMPNAEFFPTLVDFIKKMPFAEIGRVIIFLTEANNETVPHFDAGTPAQRESKPFDDFIWFSTASERKGIYVWDEETREKFYTDPAKRFVWFNEMDYHGTDPSPQFKFSVRVDGKFLPEVREAILTG